MSDIEKVKKLEKQLVLVLKIVICNKESNGDLDKAVEILRVKGISKASKKMSRDAKKVLLHLGDEKKISLLKLIVKQTLLLKMMILLILLKN